MAAAPSLLARGPWSPDQVDARWLADEYEPPEEKVAAADEAISALRERGSPSHDGVAARLVSHHEEEGRLILEVQRGHSRTLELPHRALGVERVAVSGVRVGDDWHAGVLDDVRQAVDDLAQR